MPPLINYRELVNNKHMFKEKLLKQIIALKGSSYTVTELQNKLNFRSGTERKILLKTLKALEEEGSVVRAGRGKYAVVAKHNLIKGELKGNRKGYAFLIREDAGPDLFVPGSALSGAYHGDIVLVRETAEGEGRVVKVISRSKGTLVGTYILSGGFGFVVPDDDSYFKDIYIPFDKTRNAGLMDKVVVSFTIDNKTGKPQGEITEILGLSGERNAEVLSILKNYGFSDKFPPGVLRAADKIESKAADGREDLRELLTVTIDGGDAKDFDDAISVEKRAKGYRLYVHIADVSEYVNLGGIIDREALIRGTSVYFPGSVFPMLPEPISNGVCSLRPDEDKLTVTVVMDVTDKGDVSRHKFLLGVIRSDYRMTYTDVTKILNGDKRLREKFNKVVPMLEDARALADILTNKRNGAGAINFQTRESMIILNDDGVEDIKPYPYDVSNAIIEQFMILANETVATALTRAGLPCLYRVHEAPSETKLEAFKEFIKGFNIGFKSEDVTPKTFSDILNGIKGKPFESVINKIMLRAMMKAKYSVVNSGHFGLSLEYYCHFTSPIRRYPDLMVHRILKAHILRKADEKFVDNIKKISASAATSSSERELAAEKAERDIDDYYKAVYMTRHVGEVYEGIISGVISMGIFVALENTVEGFVSVGDLPSDRYELDEINYTLDGSRYSFRIGESAIVEIKSVSIATRSINMRLVDNKNHLRKKRKGANI